MNNNFYKIYGLKVKSTIPLHDSLIINESSKNYDVEISIGETSSNIKTNKIGNFELADRYAFFSIDKVGKYEITNGNKITIEPNSNATLSEIKKFTLGSALGLILFQKNIIAIHGGAIVINNNAVIISGNIGAGKTTTIAKLLKKGYGFLSDDISSIIKDKNGNYNVHNCIPQQKLCENTAKLLGYNPSKLYKIDELKNKYLSPNIKNFITTPKKLKSLFYLDISSSNEISYKEILGTSKFQLILNNIFRREYIPNNLIKPEYIKECLNLANNISIYKINRPKNKDSINEIISIIENLNSSKYWKLVTLPIMKIN